MSLEIQEAVAYDPETGVFTWKIAPTTSIAAGSKAGSLDRHGYWQIQFCRKRYAAHRLAWFLMTGDWPSTWIDHRNLDRSDNRWSNLRLATPSQNAANQRPKGRYYKGVSLHNCGKYQAQIKCGDKYHYLGLFDTEDDASRAYCEAANRLFGEFARAA